ncbi:unnamed protein product, partial [Pylaiella littoralis]
MSWAMSPDVTTKLHFDMQETGDSLFFSSAVGTIRAVRADDAGLPFAKRAIVMCAQDREMVRTKFGLNVRESGHCQYSGPMNLESLAASLRKFRAHQLLLYNSTRQHCTEETPIFLC